MSKSLERMLARQKSLSIKTPEVPAKSVAKQVAEPQAEVKPVVEKATVVAAQAEKRRALAKPRLPDGSRFEVQYDGPQEAWRGTLVVPDDSGGQLFRNSRSTLFTLLSVLDNMYRQSSKKVAEKQE